MSWLPERRTATTPAQGAPGLPAVPAKGPAVPVTRHGGRSPATTATGGQQVVGGPPATIGYRHTPGFAVLKDSRLSPQFYDHLRSIVADPPDGMWYTSTQSYGNRLEATALAVGPDRLLVVKGVQPMRRDGTTSDGRTRLRPAGPWALDQVTIPFVAGTCHITHLTPGPLTVAGGTRPSTDRNSDIIREMSNLPAVVQDHLESYIPSRQRIRRWVRAIGPTSTDPERFWLYTTSADRLAYVHSARWHRYDPSGLPGNPANEPWAVTTLTAMIGPARRDQFSLDGDAQRPREGFTQGKNRPRSMTTGRAALPR